MQTLSLNDLDLQPLGDQASAGTGGYRLQAAGSQFSFISVWSTLKSGVPAFLFITIIISIGAPGSSPLLQISKSCANRARIKPLIVESCANW
jgi:hypothetical protein